MGRETHATADREVGATLPFDAQLAIRSTITPMAEDKLDARRKSSAYINGAVQPRYGEVHIRNRGRLPHWEKDQGLYFITFHLADSLPDAVLAKIAERHNILEAAKNSNANLLSEQKALLSDYSRTRIEEYFDRGAGSCAFNDQRVAGSMAAALRFREGKH